MTPVLELGGKPLCVGPGCIPAELVPTCPLPSPTLCTHLKDVGQNIHGLCDSGGMPPLVGGGFMVAVGVEDASQPSAHTTRRHPLGHLGLPIAPSPLENLHGGSEGIEHQ